MGRAARRARGRAVLPGADRAAAVLDDRQPRDAGAAAGDHETAGPAARPGRRRSRPAPARARARAPRPGAQPVRPGKAGAVRR
ncbi:hypothetical protein Ae168Ps1_0134 [Pseudonocardia sp. Ae168_Ps1]|nr:hypothetical protein Ae150APs1_0138 [Pseudonocardia sp. Ae150A_Ps1]OLL77728.1 hypothetical protein Ae168Ps1_0134 [Pseudonocardia sp. Ae168_Ps1]OLL88149.1 hypothetical protein Ae263Ps1_5204c [Pseudonocardia sp. Ae263_Ps1]OLL91825.1 hypothetical protein Ae356Ps1_1722 [Pseudonocardia sp. Ae356_Ps1]